MNVNPLSSLYYLRYIWNDIISKVHQSIKLLVLYQKKLLNRYFVHIYFNIIGLWLIFYILKYSLWKNIIRNSFWLGNFFLLSNVGCLYVRYSLLNYAYNHFINIWGVYDYFRAVNKMWLARKIAFRAMFYIKW